MGAGTSVALVLEDSTSVAVESPVAPLSDTSESVAVGRAVAPESDGSPPVAVGPSVTPGAVPVPTPVQKIPDDTTDEGGTPMLGSSVTIVEGFVVIGAVGGVTPVPLGILVLVLVLVWCPVLVPTM